MLNIAGTQFSLKHKSLGIYIAGCDGKCKECHNKEIQDYSIGQEFDKSKKKQIKNKIKEFDNIIENIFILGGEPLLQDIKSLRKLLSFVNSFNKKIWLWTRFQLNEIPTSIKIKCDYIKTGEYKEKLKTNENIQHGIQLATSNQNIWKQGEDY